MKVVGLFFGVGVDIARPYGALWPGENQMVFLVWDVMMVWGISRIVVVFGLWHVKGTKVGGEGCLAWVDGEEVVTEVVFLVGHRDEECYLGK